MNNYLLCTIVKFDELAIVDLTDNYHKLFYNLISSCNVASCRMAQNFSGRKL